MTKTTTISVILPTMLLNAIDEVAGGPYNKTGARNMDARDMFIKDALEAALNDVLVHWEWRMRYWPVDKTAPARPSTSRVPLAEPQP